MTDEQNNIINIMSTQPVESVDVGSVMLAVVRRSGSAFDKTSDRADATGQEPRERCTTVHERVSTALYSRQMLERLEIGTEFLHAVNWMI